MGDFGRRRSDRRQPFAFDQLLLQPGLVRDIANKGRVVNVLISWDFSDRQLNRKHLTVLAFRPYGAHLANGMSFAGPLITSDVFVMLRHIGLRHEYVYLLPRYFVAAITESSLRGG